MAFVFVTTMLDAVTTLVVLDLSRIFLAATVSEEPGVVVDRGAALLLALALLVAVLAGVSMLAPIFSTKLLAAETFSSTFWTAFRAVVSGDSD